METNKVEKHIIDSLQKRELPVSSLAWDMLEEKLDVAEKNQKKKKYRLLMYAASILLLVGLMSTQFLFNKRDSVEYINTLTTQSLQYSQTNNPELVFTTPTLKETFFESNEELFELENLKEFNRISGTILAETQSNNSLKEITKSTDKLPSTNTIKLRYIDSDALLYAATHSKEEVKLYYAKYKLSRKKALQTIENEIKKMPFTVDASSILAEVELEILEEDFQNNFYQFIKSRVADVATTIATRNH